MRHAFPYLTVFILTSLIFIPAEKAIGEDAGEFALSPLAITATGYEMPQSQASNDITVITKEEIAHLPVHDIGEALSYVPGLVMDRNGGPGLFYTPYLQGADPRQVKILIDGVPMELLSEGMADLSMQPIGNVERIEILKGSASSIWGAALGGVINIITKKPADEATGEVGMSVGDKNTRRYNGLVSGTSSGTGYLISASSFETDGFYNNEEAKAYNIFGKVTKEITGKLKAEISSGQSHTDREEGEVVYVSYGITLTQESEVSDSYQRMGLDYTPSKEVDLSLSLYNRRQSYETDNYFDYVYDYTWKDRERSYGGTLKSVWRHSEAGTFLAGVERGRSLIDVSTETKEYHSDKSALYANENLRIGRFDLNAGARYDDDSVFGSELSPSAGVVYDTGLAATLIRFNAARGFTPPPLLYRYYGISPNEDLHAERARTYQAGFETRAIPGFWSKVTFHRANITDGVSDVYDTGDIDGDGDTFELLTIRNLKRSRREGVEVNLKSAEYKGLSLSYGYTWSEVRDLETDKVVKDRPRMTHDIGLDYRGPSEIRLAVKGHWVDWNPDKADGMYGVDYTTKDENFIWDAKISKYLTKWKGAIGELFLSVHNITDDDQYRYSFYKTPKRWVEGGVSLTFY